MTTDPAADREWTWAPCGFCWGAGRIQHAGAMWLCRWCVGVGHRPQGSAEALAVFDPAPEDPA